jgi:hypothetical protein
MQKNLKWHEHLLRLLDKRWKKYFINGKQTVEENEVDQNKMETKHGNEGRANRDL